MISRITALYLAIFALVLALLSTAAYIFVAGQYHGLLAPALGTAEGASAYHHVLQRIAITIVAFDIPLLIVVGIASWILAQISLRPLLEARERERTFIADAAHELRSPLATIASVAQAQRAGARNQALTEALTLIATTAIDASALIGDLLTLARTPDVKLLVREPVDLAAIAQTCLREFRPRFENAQITLDSEVQSAIVDGDSRRLRELIRNLLENALRHARSRVLVRCIAASDRAVLQVVDDGEGVAASDRAQIFQRFFHGNNSASGSGLGLAIANWVARAHDGFLTLDETVAGASFTARLPLKSV